MAHRKYNDYHRTINNIVQKQCIDCNEWFDMNKLNFGRDGKNKDKFNIRCKECLRIKDQAYYDRNRDKLLQQATDYALTNRDKQNAQKLEYYRQHKEQFHEKHREYCEDNPEKVKEDYKAWQKKNPDKCRDYNLKHRQHDITEKEWMSCLNAFDNTCAYCGLPIEKHIVKRNGKYIIMNFHKEHVDDKGYNDLRNAVPSCQRCNSGKHQDSLEEWYLKQKFFSIDRYIKIMWWINEGYKEFIGDKPPYRIVKKKNDENNKYHHELWTVDEKRNMIELIYKAVKKKDVAIYAKSILIEIVQ